MKDNVIISMANEFRCDYDIISGKIFYKNTSKEVENVLKEIVEKFQLKRKDAEELLDHCMLYNEKGLWPELDIVKDAKIAPLPDKLAFPLTEKQLIILNRIFFHPNDEIMFITTGIGGSGKSTFLNIIKQIFDNDVSPCSLSDLTNEFNVAEAVKHRIIASDELAKGELNLPIIKQLVSKQMIHVNPKNRTPYEVKSQSVLFFCCNKAPRIDVTDTGVLRRIVYYEMNTKIKNPNPLLRDKLFTKDDLLGFLTTAYKFEKTWKTKDWFSYFEQETHKYLMKDNSVYICKYSEDYFDYSNACRNKGLKPYSEPIWEQIRELFKEWEVNDELEGLL